ncbi:MAG: hypothetical protein KKH32_00080, partial [Bacteroidetes bacterium]|nr:hypothetical protein [Bacteroidota bacterium]
LPAKSAKGGARRRVVKIRLINLTKTFESKKPLTALTRNILKIIIIFFIGLIPYLHGAPLRNFPQVVVQPSGEIIHCFASGDEYHNWLHDAEGYTIIQHPVTGYYNYAFISNGELAASSYVVGEVDPRTIGLEKWLNISSAALSQKRDGALRNLPRERGLAPKTGTINNIVIYIRFNGESEFTDLKSTYDNMFNSSVSGNNSMYNYFREVSYNSLTITSTFYPTSGSSTVVSYQDTYTRGYYQPYSATNTIGYTNNSELTSREHTLLMNAVNAVNSQIPSGLNVDGDNDGRVDNVCFIISGSPDGWSDLLWPHMWALY